MTEISDGMSKLVNNLVAAAFTLGSAMEWDAGIITARGLKNQAECALVDKIAGLEAENAKLKEAARGRDVKTEPPEFGWHVYSKRGRELINELIHAIKENDGGNEVTAKLETDAYWMLIDYVSRQEQQAADFFELLRIVEIIKDYRSNGWAAEAVRAYGKLERMLERIQKERNNDQRV